MRACVSRRMYEMCMRNNSDVITCPSSAGFFEIIFLSGRDGPASLGVSFPGFQTVILALKFTTPTPMCSFQHIFDADFNCACSFTMSATASSEVSTFMI